MTNAAQQTETNADPVELKKFGALAERWWDENGDMGPLHAINPLRLGYIEKHSTLNGRKVVDVGCGGGILTEALSKAGAEATGIDMASESVAVAQSHATESGLKIRYLETTAEALADAEPEQFDVVTCLEMLEHVPDPASVIQACARLAKPGGDVFFSTINRHPKAWLFAVVGAEYVLNMLPKGTHDYQKFIKPSEMDRWCRETGLVVKDLTGLHYNPAIKHYSLGPGVDVNYLMHTVKAG